MQSSLKFGYHIKGSNPTSGLRCAKDHSFLTGFQVSAVDLEIYMLRTLHHMQSPILSQETQRSCGLLQLAKKVDYAYLLWEDFILRLRTKYETGLHACDLYYLGVTS
ncbi:hypothetical protein Tco_0402056 [Tanacetum coccineum]